MSFFLSLEIYCDKTISELCDICLDFKNDYGELTVENNEEFNYNNTDFTVSIYSENEYIDLFNDYFKQNVNEFSIEQVDEKFHLVVVYFRISRNADPYLDRVVKFIGEFMGGVSGDLIVFNYDLPMIIRHKNIVYVDTSYSHDNDEYGYRLKHLNVNFIKKKLTDPPN